MDSLTLIADIQSLFAFADGVLRWLSTHAYSRHYLLLAAILFWTGYRRFAFRLALATMASTLLFIVVKPFLQSPRPYWLDERLFRGMNAGGYGMPSGHSQNAAVFGGIALCTVKNVAFTLLALLFIITIGLSRVYLGVHFPSQIFVALGVGFIFVILWMSLEHTVINKLSTLSRCRQLALGLAVAVTPLTITLIHFLLFKSTSSIHAAHKLLFLMTGFTIGLVLYQTLKTSLSDRQPSFHLFLTQAIPGSVMVVMLWQWSAVPITLIDDQTLLYSYCLARGCILVLFATILWPRVHEQIQPLWASTPFSSK